MKTKGYEMINALRGMKDIAFEEADKFIYTIETATQIAKRYGYQYIETPLLEETKLFKRSVGERRTLQSNTKQISTKQPLL